MISRVQSRGVAVISVVSVLFLTKRLLPSIYGMNFEWMPGLDRARGFWIAAG